MHVILEPRSFSQSTNLTIIRLSLSVRYSVTTQGHLAVRSAILATAKLSLG